jgi:hypothetical protein
LALQGLSASSSSCFSSGPSVHPQDKYGNVGNRFRVGIRLTSRPMHMDGSAQSCEEQTHGWEDHVELKALEGIVQLSLTVV